MCTKYNFNFWHSYVIPLATFEPLCESTDKTYLFLSSVLRTFIYYFIYWSFEARLNLSKEYPELYWIFLGLVIINIIILLYVTVKVTRYEKLDFIPEPIKEKPKEDDVTYYL